MNKIGLFCRYLLLIMTILGALNAILRYASKFVGKALTSNLLLEMQWYLFGMIFLLGAGYTLRASKHVRVDVLYSSYSQKIKDRIDMLGTLFFLIPFSLVGVWMSIDFVMNSWTVWEQSPDSGGLPRYPIKTVIPLGFLLLGIEGGSWLLQLWKQRESHD